MLFFLEKIVKCDTVRYKSQLYEKHILFTYILAYLCTIFSYSRGSINKCWFKFSGWIFGHLKIAQPAL